MATNRHNLSKHEVGRAFVQRHQSDVIGVLHGWDRLRLQGTLRSMYYQPVMDRYLKQAGVMWKDFKNFATALSGRVRQSAAALAEEYQRPMIYLNSSRRFPYLIQVCMNGREWLGRQMDQAGISYRREDNCFPWIGDLERAQALMDQQHRTDWPGLLNPLVQQCHPLQVEINRPFESEYYWTAAQSEYATDVMFGQREGLLRIYPALVHHAVMTFGAEQVLRFLGRSGKAGVHDEVKTDRRRRVEGVRVKHWLNKNSLKFYDKGRVLRSEVTINEPKDFRVYRRAENQPAGKEQWRILRRGLADFNRRAEVSRAATDRHLTALAAVHVQSSLAQDAAQLCQAVWRDGQRYRALNALGESDAELLAIVNRGEYAINGLRNRDVRARLYPPTQDKGKERREMAAVGRKLRLLRAHGLIAKVSKTHRYVVTEKGRRIIMALLAARQASTEKLTALAA